MLDPIYTEANTKVAYQLNWSLSAFAHHEIPPSPQWLPALQEATEPDGVRILSCHHTQYDVIQFWLSTKPNVSPAVAIQRVKGRLQHLLCEKVPRLWRRNYRIESIGEVNDAVLQKYVERQPSRHPQGDPRVQEWMESVQFDDHHVNLAGIRYSSHGQFAYNLHVVLENADHLADIRPNSLAATRDMIIRVCRKKAWLLSRIGLVGNHLHMLLGCDVMESPLLIGLSLMNNLAFAHDMKPVLTYSFYAGTFGNYDRHAIRQMLAE